MENIFLRLVAWCYRHPLTAILALALTVGLSVGSMVEEKPVYQGDYWLHCGGGLPVQVKAYHFENKFYYEDLSGKRLQ